MQIHSTPFVGSDALTMLVTDPRTGVLPALLIIAAVIDYRTHKSPNWLTMGGAAFALIYGVAISFSPLGGFALGFLILLPFRVLKVMGADDVKLMRWPVHFSASPTRCMPGV